MAKCLSERAKTSRADISDVSLWLHPELLSNDSIRRLLIERSILPGGEGDISRENLLKLFAKHVMPQPQRELPGNRRRGKNACRSGAHAQCSATSSDRARKRPLIVFDGSSTNTGTVKLKRTEGGTEGAEKAPVKSSSSSNRTIVSHAAPVPKSLSEKDLSRHTATTTSDSSSPTGVKLKRIASSEGEPDGSGELKSPEAKKKIQPITWP